jgi:hypothetical protein
VIGGGGGCGGAGSGGSGCGGVGGCGAGVCGSVDVHTRTTQHLLSHLLANRLSPIFLFLFYSKTSHFAICFIVFVSVFFLRFL